MKKILLSILCISLYACQENSTTDSEVSQEEQEQKMVEDRLAELGTEVDEYPSFKECESITTKDEKLKCFTGKLSKLYQEALNSQKLAIGDALSDTVKVTIVINTEGNLSVKSVEATCETHKLVPNLQQFIKNKSI